MRVRQRDKDNMPGRGLVRLAANVGKWGLIGAGADAMLSQPRAGDGSFPGARVVQFAREPGCGTRLWFAGNSYLAANNPQLALESSVLGGTMSSFSWIGLGKSTATQVAEQAGDQFMQLVRDEQARLDNFKKQAVEFKHANPGMAPFIEPLMGPFNHALAPIPAEELLERKSLVVKAVAAGVDAKGKNPVQKQDIAEVVRLSAAELVYSKAFVGSCPTHLEKRLEALMTATIKNGKNGMNETR